MNCKNIMTMLFLYTSFVYASQGDSPKSVASLALVDFECSYRDCIYYKEGSENFNVSANNIICGAQTPNVRYDNKDKNNIIEKAPTPFVEYYAKDTVKDTSSVWEKIMYLVWNTISEQNN